MDETMLESADTSIKGIVDLKLKILSSLTTYIHVVANLYDFISSVKRKVLLVNIS